VKKELLQYFYQEPSQFFSGEKLSRRFHCTRATIWKTIEELRKEGYQIEAVPNRGYRLLSTPDRLYPHEIQARLTTAWAGRHIQYHSRIPSTQLKAHELAKGGAEEGTLVIAEEQTGGKGRLGRPWHSPEGTGIWMSLILRPKLPLEQLPRITLVTAVAIVDAIRHELRRHAHPLPPETIRIKWPNDVYVVLNPKERKKVCGILTEVNAEIDRVNYCILGIGINVNQKAQDFPEELRHKATSLALSSGAPWNRVKLVTAFLARFETLYETFQQHGFQAIKSLWEERAFPIGTPIQVHIQDQLVSGTYQGITEQGALLFGHPNGQLEMIHSGDVLV